MKFTEIRDGMVTMEMDEHIAAMLAKACLAACYLTDHRVPKEHFFDILGEQGAVSLKYEGFAAAFEAAALAACNNAEIPTKEQGKHALTAWRVTGPRTRTIPSESETEGGATCNS
jgi:hypothetical protein